VTALLKRLWAVGGFRTKRVVLGIGNPRVVVRDLTVPRATPQLVRESLPLYVQDLLTVPVSDAVLDFYPTSDGTLDGIPILNGLLVAAVKDVVTTNIVAAQRAGLTAVNVDLIPFALVRLLTTTVRMGTIALVDVGARTTTFVVAVRGIPQFVRIIPTGGHDLTTLLAQRLNLTPVHAENLKRSAGLIPAAQDEAANTIQAYSSDLLDSIRNTLRYFASAHPEIPVEQLVLSGGGSHLDGLREALAEITRLPVSRSHPFAGVPVAKHARHGDPDHAGEMTVALGLALGSIAGSTTGLLNAAEPAAAAIIAAETPNPRATGRAATRAAAVPPPVPAIPDGRRTPAPERTSSPGHSAISEHTP
jgi:type IV pilus assembly protein PilM